MTGPSAKFRFMHDKRCDLSTAPSSQLIQLCRYGCSTAVYKSQEGSRVSAVSRNSQRSQDTAMSTLILSAVYRQARRICKEKVRNDDQMSSLSSLLSDPRRRHVWQPSHIFSSQPIGGPPCSERWQPRGSEMQ